MAEENSKLRHIFPKGTKAPTPKTQSVSVGELGASLKDNDPETLKDIAKHKVTDHGDREDTGAFKVATKYSLDDPKNKRLKGHGKGKDKEVYEATCPKCGSDCKCGKNNKDKSQDEPAYKKDKALLLGGKKIREDTLANRLAMDILQERKEARLGEMVNPYADKNPIGGGGMGGGFSFRGSGKASVPNLSPVQGGPRLKNIPGTGGEIGSEVGTQGQRVRGLKDLYNKGGAEPEGGKKIIGKAVHKIDMGNPKFPRTVKGGVKEDVKLSKVHDTHDTDFPTGPAVGKAAEGETQGHHKPDGPTANKSKKIVKTDTKKPNTQ